MKRICVKTAGKAITSMLKKCGLVVDEKEESMISVGMKFIAEYNLAAIRCEFIGGKIDVEDNVLCEPDKACLSIKTEVMG